MKLEKAIEILQSHVEWCDPVKEVDTFDALKLGIEALKREEVYRKGPLGINWALLPGGTEE